MSPHDLEEHLLAILPSRWQLLQSWVAVNSHSNNVAGVNSLGKLTATAFEPLGFTAEHVASEEQAFGDHVFLRRPGNSDRTIAFVSHLDTVYTAEEEQANDFRYSEDIEADRIYGPGVGDIKGGTLQILLMLETLAACQAGILDRANLIVALNAGEERLISSFPRALRERLTGLVEGVLVFEGGSPRDNEWPLVVGRKGRIDFTVRVRGRSAHAGIDFWQGENAIVAAADLVQRIAALSDQSRDISVNVGRIRGGTEINRVPDEVVLEGEVRMFVDELDEFRRRITAVAEGCRLSAEAEFPRQVSAWPENEGSERLFEIWRAAGAALGMNVTRQRRGGLSDGNRLWEGFPTIDGLGPAGGSFHCSTRCEKTGRPPEYIVRSSMIQKAKLNCLAVSDLLAARSST